jgi:hypothetical protein
MDTFTATRHFLALDTVERKLVNVKRGTEVRVTGTNGVGTGATVEVVTLDGRYAADVCPSAIGVILA